MARKEKHFDKIMRIAHTVRLMADHPAGYTDAERLAMMDEAAWAIGQLMAVRNAVRDLTALEAPAGEVADFHAERAD